VIAIQAISSYLVMAIRPFGASDAISGHLVMVILTIVTLQALRY
jgi:hypothetical protein